MITFQDKLVKTVNHVAAVRAQQLWPFLMSKASMRQTVRYPEVCRFFGYQESATGHGPLRWPLAHIMYFCEINNMPLLNDLVVNLSGIPGYVTGSYDGNKLERVFAFDWYQFPIPSAKALAEAYDQKTGRISKDW